MKTLGLIGGTTWHSTAEYYRYLNEGVNQELGGDEYAKCILYSLNFGELKKNSDAGNLPANLEILTNAAQSLEKAGAEALVLCANTMHMYAEELKKRTSLPLIHIVTATANAIKKQKLARVILLGTKFTMEMDFFKNMLHEEHIESIIPSKDDRDFIQHSIFDELSHGVFKPATRAKYLSIINNLAATGAEGVILGCTEIPLLIKQEDMEIPAFDTTKIHADAAVEFALGNPGNVPGSAATSGEDAMTQRFAKKMEEHSEKKYSNGEVVVHWQPHLCKHSGICFRGLPNVFDPRKRPWVNIQGASSNEIVEQVGKCPSGALSIAEKKL